MNAGTMWLLARPRPGGSAGLQILAAAVGTLLTFATVILAARFWIAPADGYRILALSLVALLLVPLTTLGASAARLAARSREDRLATLRLLGLRAAAVRRTAVVESTAVQAIGVLTGTLLAVPLPLLLGLIPVHGKASPGTDAMLPAWTIIGIPALLIAVAAASALLGLRAVLLAPLGVRTRQNAPKLSALRILIAAGVIIAGVLLLQFASPSWGTTGLVVAIGIVVLAVMSVLGIAGPYLVGLFARLRIGKTSDPAALIAARRNVDDPKGAWRQVSTIALTSFIVIPAGSMLGFLDAVQRSDTALSPDQLALFTDARTMLLALVAASFIVAACQTAITQAAEVREHQDLYLALHRIGMPENTMHRTRRLQARGPVLIAVTGSALASTLLTFPLVGVAAANSPIFVLSTLLLLVAGAALVELGLLTTRPALRRALAAPHTMQEKHSTILWIVIGAVVVLAAVAFLALAS